MIDNLINFFSIDVIIKYAIFFAIILGFKIFSPIFSRIIIFIFHKLFRMKSKITESSFYKPLKTFFSITGLYIGILFLNFPSSIVFWVRKIYRILIILVIASGLANIFNENSGLFKKFEESSSFNNDGLNRFIGKILKVLIYIVAGFMILSDLNYDLGGLVTGLGIGSAVVALAAQDFVKSIIGGFSILTDKPFIIGDFIEVDKYQGTVTDITFRSVRVKTVDNAIVNIPNSVVTTSYVVNLSRMEQRRFSATLRLGLGLSKDTLERAISKIKTVLAAEKTVVKGSAQVHLDCIESDCNKIIVYAYIDEVDYEKYMRIKERINCNILDALESEDIFLAYPTQMVYIEKSE